MMSALSHLRRSSGSKYPWPVLVLTNIVLYFSLPNVKSGRDASDYPVYRLDLIILERYIRFYLLNMIWPKINMFFYKYESYRL